MSEALYTCAWCREEQYYPWSVTVHGRECCSYDCANKTWDALDEIRDATQ